MAADPEKAQAQCDSDSAAERASPPRTRDEEEGIEGIEGAFASASTVSRSGDEGTDNDNDADADADHHRAASKIETAHSLDGNGLNRRVSRVDSLRHKASASGSRGRFSHPLAHVRTSESFLVDFDGPDDPYRPLNWPFRKKCITTLLYGLVTFGSSWASSAFAPASGQVAEQFGVSAEVSTLGVTLLLLGFGFGGFLVLWSKGAVLTSCRTAGVCASERSVGLLLPCMQAHILTATATAARPACSSPTSLPAASPLAPPPPKISRPSSLPGERPLSRLLSTAIAF